MADKRIDEQNPNFGLVWDQKTGRYFPAMGKSKGEKGAGINSGRFEGPYGLVHDPKPSFTAEEEGDDIDKLINAVASGTDPKEALGLK